MVLRRGNAARNIHADDLANAAVQRLRILRDGNRVHVGHEQERLVLVLIVRHLPNAADIVADRKFAARLKTRQKPLFHDYSSINSVAIPTNRAT